MARVEREIRDFRWRRATGVISLDALHSAALASVGRRDWPTALVELQLAGLVDAAGVDSVRRLHAFGELIGNTDMHFGNLAFWLDDALPFRVAPGYDMLPMLWAPSSQGEMVARKFAPAPPLPAVREAWQEAARWAEVFWGRVAEDRRLSAEFLGFAQEAYSTVRGLSAFEARISAS